MAVASRLFAVIAALALSACAAEDLTKPPTPLGDFDLGFNIVVAKNAQQVGPSRQVTAMTATSSTTLASPSMLMHSPIPAFPLS
jgi:hypothetical protein